MIKQQRFRVIINNEPFSCQVILRDVMNAREFIDVGEAHSLELHYQANINIYTIFTTYQFMSILAKHFTLTFDCTIHE